MSSIDIERLRISGTGTVRDAISTIDGGGVQFALVLDAKGTLLGVVTDGDVRRGLLRGVTLDDSVSEVMNSNPRLASVTDSAEVIEARMSEYSVRHMPIVDEHGVVVGVTTFELGRNDAVTTPVVLMAGGRGQRLYPLTRDVPKPMLPIGDMPLLEIILRNLAAQGFVDVYISVNYLADVIIDYFGDGERLGLRIKYVHEDHPLGTAGALAQLQGTVAEPFIVMNSDLLTHVDLRRFIAFHRKQQAKGTMGVREHAFEIPFGVVSLDGAKVVSIEEKPLHRSLVNAGIYALDPVALSFLTPNEYCDMPSLLAMMVDDGLKLCAFPIHESWLDVGRPEDLSHARDRSSQWTPS